MKYFYLLIFAVLPIELMAQPVINNVYIPEVGDSYTFDMIDSNYTLPSPGANQVWDYSNLSFYFSNLNFDFLDPSNSPYGSNFPNANISEYQQGGDAYAYYESTVMSYDNWGIQTSQSQINYTDPMTYLYFPITYNDEFTDTGTGFIDGGPATRDSEITMEGYGYGDLILPNQTLNNILCVKLVTLHADTYDTTSDEILVEEYLFLSPDIPFRVLSLISFQDLSGGGPKINHGYLMSTFVGLQDESSANNVHKTYPNPVNIGDNFNISIESNQPRNVNINLIDVTGKIVYAIGSKTLTIGKNIISVESDSLEAGIYLVKISAESNEFTSTVKMIVK